MGGFVGRVTIKMIVDEFTRAKLSVCAMSKARGQHSF